ncbi:phospho-N-acetylmuramoyl-pentapeptide-transferase [Puniceicoccus vermicola]|uniref:Phospho-N-acetylmuramoyl-pentapeptide-transferase n=1 Tax=Puniceicoccus vermicola TaxID=388746 RepID=A0A7X1B3Z9_9BACT|nr:phospho-N-acetylmuramoyl-pentapeptide-transferase [Puniceicoccus vermicola]MBC2603990.1 phospho-N-acetylmuramoyl-pentapeptide-transferase [Puniceicoccus vermicola]
MLTFLEQFESYWGPLRLFGFITVRAVMAGLFSFILALVLGPKIIRYLQNLRMREAGRSEEVVGQLAVLHEGKKETPTMGGLIIFSSITISIFLFAVPNVYILVSWFVYAGLTAIGFIDDYRKVSRKNSDGLNGRLKLLAQAAIAAVALTVLLLHPATSENVRELWVPFYKDVVLSSMPIWVLFPFLFLILSGSSNAINLTDGIDGLAIGCTVTSAMAFGLMAYFSGNAIISDYLLISFLPGTGELAVLCAALLGASLGFLWYNAHPAEVFMGDTGSLALGGLVGIVAFLIHQPFTLVIVGGIFVLEAVSVILQVGSYKTRRKRIFLMAPIHHHFELRGWHENKVVIRFWIISLLCAIAGLASLRIR